MITEGTTAVGARAARSASSRNRSQGVPVARPARSGPAADATEERDDAAAEGAAPASEGSLMWRRIVWLVAGVAWVFCALSLLSYSTGDAPAAGVYPHNQPPHNLCGIAGAMLAHYSYQLTGSGAIVLLLLGSLWLGISATGRRVNQIPLRVLGALMMAASIAGLQALLLPTTGPVPSLPGGLVGSLGAARLVASFSQVGSFLVLALMLCIGAIVTLDVWAVLVAIWTGRAIYVSAKTSGRVALAAARAANERRQQYRAGRLAYAGADWQGDDRTAAGSGTSSYLQRGSGSRLGNGPRLDDVSDDEALPTLADSRTTRVLKARPAGVKPNGAQDAEDDPSLFDPAQSAGLSAADPKRRTDSPEVVAARSTEPVVPDPDRAAAQPVAGSSAESSPRSYSPEELRAKMAKLPVRFAAKSARAATDEDLRELQERGAEEADTGGKGGGTGPMNLEGYRFPGLDLLEEPEANFSQTMEAFVREQAENLERALREYRIDGEVVGVESGPVITLYEVRLAPGTKVAVLQAVSSDLARALKSVNIRIVPNTAGRDTVGIEVPNLHKEKVRLKELMNRGDIHSKMTLPMFLGKDASGEPLICDLAAIPHLLIAGTTGSGKSVCMNTIIMSFLYTKKPNELKLVLVDPKMVELSQFKDIPHLMCPVVTEMGKAAAILEWAVAKMDERYELLAEAGCRDISGYNALEWDELKERLGVSTPEEEAKVPRKLPYMVFVIDELADLMMTNKEVEHSIVRIAQKARAVGMHLIVATQRPQANVVTGLIKSNMPGRMAFKVASGMDSRIVLDQKGGELLLGQGDMLYLSPRSSKLTRAQGTLVDDKEIRRVVKFMREVAQPTFERSLMQIRPGMSAEQAEAGTLGAMGRDVSGGAGPGSGVNGNFNWGDRDGFQAAQEDPMFDEAVEVVIESRRGSVSMLQRRLAIGYTRAARLIEMMGEAGILGGHKGTVSRDVIMTLDEWRAIKAQAAADAAAAEGLSTGPDGALNSHPKTGETLEVVQARLNGTGGDGGRTGASPTRGTDLSIAAAFADEQEAQEEEDELDDEADDEGDDAYDDDADAINEVDGEEDDADESDDDVPFTPDVQTRRPGSQTRAS